MEDFFSRKNRRAAPNRNLGRISGFRNAINSYDGRYANTYFWRTHDKAEIDYIEEEDGLLNAFELKWKQRNVHFSRSFRENYPNHTTTVVSRENFEKFVGIT